MKQTEDSSAFYFQLTKYRPMCYSGKGVPFFMIHQNYWNSAPCIIFVNIIFIAATILTFLSASHSKNQQFLRQLVNLFILSLILINLSWFLTVFMNPGIVSENHMDYDASSEVKFCQRCNRRVVDMSHCKQCQTCVLDLDHHCGFFGKCIAGSQRFAFYGFLLFMFCGFVLILAGISVNLN